MSKMKTMDGNEAAAYAAYAFTEIASIYPDYAVFADGRTCR
jgi:pyruvate-ferredoxin/flavodoxin oxidoreductase